MTKNYTIQPFQIGPDRSEIGLLTINFQAENLSSAQSRAMLYATDVSFMSDIHGLKLIRNNAEVWRWQKGDPALEVPYDQRATVLFRPVFRSLSIKVDIRFHLFR